ncbi:MAG: glycosyltransferase [Nanoarchaeota archaeon]
MKIKEKRGNYINEYEFRVIGMQRTGNHPIINWLLGHFKGKICILNHVSPNKNPFLSHSIKQGSNTSALNIEKEKSGLHEKKQCIVYNYEDEKISEIATKKFEKNRDSWIGSSKKKFDLLILRDPYNLFASRLKREYTTQNKIPLRTKKDARKISSLWKSYAKEFIGKTNYLKNKFVINYNLWYSSKTYRKKISKSLGLEFTDKNFKQVPNIGNGSSFDGLKFNNHTEKMKVLQRWKTYKHHEVFREAVKDVKLIKLSEKIFGKINGTEILSKKYYRDSVLVTLADIKNIDQAKQLFAGAHFSGGWKGDYLLLSYKIPEKELEEFRKKGIYIKNCKPLFGLKSPHPNIVSSKLYIFKENMKRWKNVLFLDSDILVKADLDKLSKVHDFNVVSSYQDRNLNHKMVKLVGRVEKNERNLQKEIASNYDLEKRGFNAGVIALSTNIINKNTFKDIIAFQKKYGSVIKTEEGVLGLYFQKITHYLPKPYNMHIPSAIEDMGLKIGKIKGINLHFVGSPEIKPWKPKSLHHKQWKNNLKKFNKLDIDKLHKPADRWSVIKTYYYHIYLSIRKRLVMIKKINTQPIIYYFLDRQAGQIGIIIKKMSPLLYSKLRLINPLPNIHP